MLVRSMLQLSQWARNGQLGITALQQSQFQKRTYFNYLNYIKSKKYPFEDPEFDNKYVEIFNDPKINGFDIRRHLTALFLEDCVPEPIIVSAALRACRRVNDFALAMRLLELIRHKAGFAADEIYPYIIQEIQPTLDELGIPTLQQMGIDKPIYWVEKSHNQF